MEKSKPIDYWFKSAIKDYYMTSHDSVFYVDKNNMFRYANLAIQKVFDITKQPTKIFEC